MAYEEPFLGRGLSSTSLNGPSSPSSLEVLRPQKGKREDMGSSFVGGAVSLAELRVPVAVEARTSAREGRRVDGAGLTGEEECDPPRLSGSREVLRLA